ncbi:MAG TPA: relaxase/mobilization nuclease domain-containing protein [Candidatus Mailhella merdavium]|nr:relaxase/mobilization nuclease domain-containing protein [Candidatus Mailhella merdavium]
MLMKVFPHGTGEGDKPSRYLVRPDYPGRDTAPPQVLRGDPAMTRALIDSIERRWKFTSGALSWHPEEKISEAQEEEVMDAFERVAFAGLEADQRNILWVRHTHAGHHELHFLIPRLELSSGKDFNACPPGWQKDFDVFRDLFNWREGWARPDDPERTRDELPKKADLFKARMARWGKEIRESDRDRAKEVIHAFLKEKVTQGLVRNREDVLNALKEQGLNINREGRDYISVIAPDSGMKMRFRGGFYARGWTPKVAQDEESEEKKKETARSMVARLQPAFERVIEKRAACNIKRYPAKWKQLPDEEALLLPQIQEDTIHDRNRTDADAEFETDGGELQRPADGLQHEAGQPGRQADADSSGTAYLEAIVHRCQRSVQQLADLVGDLEKRRIERERQNQPRRRMR